jgi:hypothetical protein
MRHIFCAFYYLIFASNFYSKLAMAYITPTPAQETITRRSPNALFLSNTKSSFLSTNSAQVKSYLTQSEFMGEAAQVRLDNFISVSNSNPQQNQDLFIAIESIREFHFNAIDSKWNLGSRYSELEGFQYWLKELNTQYVKDIPDLDTTIGFRVGRFYQTNLKMDSIWGLGVVEPQFRGDPLNPLHQGLTGLSVWMDLGDVQFSLFASPLSFPDTGVSYNIQDGQVVSRSPWHTEAPTSVQYEGQKIDLSYNLDINNRFDLLSNPSVIAGVKSEVYGLNVSMNGGVVPSSQFFLEVAPKAMVDDNNQAFVQANVVPRLLPKAIFAVKFDKKVENTNLWGELFTERHQGSSKNNNPDLYQSEIYDNTFLAMGLDSIINFSRMDLNIGFSYLRNTSKNKLNQLNEFKFSNYIYNNAIETRLALKIYPSPLSVNFNFKYDLDESAFLASPRLTYRTKDQLQVYAQYDLIGRSNDVNVDGFLAQQAANDRFTVGLNYVF